MGRVVMRTARRASKAGDSFDPDVSARCLHFLEVMKSETWRAGHERIAGGVATCEPCTTRSTASCLPIFSVTEAGRKGWWSKEPGCGPGSVQGSRQGRFARGSRRRFKACSEDGNAIA